MKTIESLRIAGPKIGSWHLKHNCEGESSNLNKSRQWLKEMESWYHGIRFTKFY